jgi:ABC-2 type transport system ATP-binding protein
MRTQMMTRTREPRPAAGRPAVEIAHLRKTYGALVAVDDVSFSVAEGEIFGILGPNGRGRPLPSNAPSGSWSRRA